MADGFKQAPVKKKEEPEKTQCFTKAAAYGAKSRVQTILETIAMQKSASFEALEKAADVGKELMKTLDDLSEPQTQEKIAELKAKQERLLSLLSEIGESVMRKKAGKPKPAEAPKPVELPKPAPKHAELKPPKPVELPKPAPKPELKLPIAVEKPKPAPKAAKPEEEWVERQPEEAPKPAPQVIRPAAPAEEVKWARGDIEFTAAVAPGSARFVRIMNRNEKWSVLFRDDGSTEVRTMFGSAVIREGKIEGALDGATAHALSAKALSFCALEQNALARLKEKAKEEEKESWRSQEQEWR